MTILNSYYKKPTTLPSVNLVKPNQVKHIIKSRLSGFASISLPVIVIGLLFLVIVTYVSIYAGVHSYDYKIYSLKTEMREINDENIQLKESLVKNVSPDKIATWATENSYIEVTKVEYFDLTFDILAANISKTANQ